jgi:Myb-like DNA-binding domain
MRACTRALQLGNKWASIARMLERRTDNQVKNRFHSKLRRGRGLASPAAAEIVEREPRQPSPEFISNMNAYTLLRDMFV